MPAYWPWIQVGRAWGATQAFAVNAAAGAGAGGLGANFNPEMVQLFPELKAAVPGLKDPPPLTDHAAAQFLRGQSSERPWVIVLDDLHWADNPTLQLLAFVARELSNVNALAIATYRDTASRA